MGGGGVDGERATEANKGLTETRHRERGKD